MAHDFTPQIQKLENILRKGPCQEHRTAYGTYLFAKKVYGSKGIRYLAPNEFDEHSIDRARRWSTDTSFNTIFIDKKSPHILTLGNQQMVLRLDDNWVAKAIRHWAWDGVYILGATSFEYGPMLTSTMDFLEQEFGFQIPRKVLDYRYCDSGVELIESPHGLFMIAKNHTEGGKYLVEDISDETIDRLQNVDEVRSTVEGIMDQLESIYNKSQLQSSSLTGSIDRHLDDGVRAALTKMFFLKINPKTQTGELTPGDFDHVVLYDTSLDS